MCILIEAVSFNFIQPLIKHMHMRDKILLLYIVLPLPFILLYFCIIGFAFWYN